MSTESDDLRAFLADSDKLIKASEKSLKSMEAMRKDIGLQAGASKELLEQVPESQDAYRAAQKELNQFLRDNQSESAEADTKDKKRKKKRSKMARTVHNKLRI
ncbi:hypothetical protein [Parendozoicomonas haliclonae]|uniref:Uncharacterized protein n=1 Tax=Parendozoicomonas haliclonae TaxID=1960125 RepID=A0A1X7AQR5_9GAMM|nr:hypothetical protein [Parendozoicomonas haliclonae]SMA50438.1 hypothetical protein EHSB41UT_04236 [Parendozoicomonas haliclonae]